jgi:hypothetical protein
MSRWIIDNVIGRNTSGVIVVYDAGHDDYIVCNFVNDITNPRCYGIGENAVASGATIEAARHVGRVYDTKQKAQQAAKSASLYAIRLKFSLDSLLYPNIDRVLQAIGEAIEMSIQSIETFDNESAAATVDYHLDEKIDEECDVIEDLLGTAFVVCQTDISSVVSSVKILHSLYKKEHEGEALETTPDKKREIMAFGSLPVASSEFSEVQVIDAFANYFKHREDEAWVIGDWDKLQGRSFCTVQTIRAVGASWGSTGNLRTGAKVLGNETYTNMSVFVDILQRWRQNLYNGYREELESKNLIFIQPGRSTSVCC